MFKVCLGIIESAAVDPIKQIQLFKRIGFDAFFSGYAPKKIAQYRKAADEFGMDYQSIHAPFIKMRHMWYPSEQTACAKQELKDCIAAAAEYAVPIVIVHPFIGFDVNEATESGIYNFKEVVDFAKEKGVRLAFENVEGEAYLEALMNAFRDDEHIGFCWDTGHELCYNKGKDMLALYGDRLIATHINDNMDVSGEKITSRDDLHLIPFDGIKDWTDAMARLDRCGYDGTMTFELKISRDIDEKYGTHYSKMDFEDYIKRIYESAQQLIALRHGHGENR